MWGNVKAVIRREYLQRVRSKWFVFSTVAAPLLMAGLVLVPAFLVSRSEEDDRRIAVVDGTGVLVDRLLPALAEGGWTVVDAPSGPDAAERLRERAAEGEIAGFVALDSTTLRTGEATFFTADRPTALRLLAMRSAVTRAALEYHLEESDADASSILAGGDLHLELLAEGGPSLDEPRFLVAYVGAFLLYMVLLIYAVSVMRATLEEKTSRVVEIIISSMEPWHLMLGKIVGVGAVGLTQLTAWVASGVLLFAMGLPSLLASPPALAELDGIVDALPGPGLVALFLGYFVLGYFMYSGLYAAVGAMCSTDEEAQQAQSPLIILLVVPILMVTPVIEDPMTPMATVASLFPLFTPILMWARVAGGGVPGWQIGLSFLLMAGAVFGIAWVAGRIYKVGILMTGKRPTLPELWRWVREA